jgi:transcriptional regulator with XRE-family HTH domain
MIEKSFPIAYVPCVLCNIRNEHGMDSVMTPDQALSDDPQRDRARQLGAALRAYRKAQRINMTAAAEAAGISRVTWYRLEKGEPGVSFGALLAAAHAIGKELRLSDAGKTVPASDALALGALPLEIALSEFPALRRLAWQVGGQVETLTPGEAAGIYARNARHLDKVSLDEREMTLMRALRQVFGADVPDV